MQPHETLVSNSHKGTSIHPSAPTKPYPRPRRRTTLAAVLLAVPVLAPLCVRSCSAAVPPPPPLPAATAAEAGFVPDRLAIVDSLVADAVNKQGIPGAVLLVARNGKVALQKAYGFAGLRPEKRPMQEDTVFDLASLTKVIATTTAMGKLLEEGKVELDAPVARYLPVFAAAGGDKAQITIRQLMTHCAGLPPDGDYAGKHLTLAQVLDDVSQMRLRSTPGTQFVYSDLSFITLQGVVEAVTGQTLDRYCGEQFFEPMGMKDTTFLPGPELSQRCAATTAGDDVPEKRGKVHDPTAAALSGVAGDAGLFSTAADLARFGQMLLNGGEYVGVRVLKPETVAMLTTKASPYEGEDRGLGWDIDSGYAIRGQMMPGSFGHTGFTGTSIWIDPSTRSFAILLTNGVHNPSSSRAVIRLRRAVSTATARALAEGPLTLEDPTMASSIPQHRIVQTGLDVLEAENFARLEGKSIGIVCNATSVDRQGRHIIDLVSQNKKVKIAALFSPEHGIRGEMDSAIDNTTDTKTGLPVFSLYDYRRPAGERYRPTPEMLRGIDVLVFDIQEIGTRYYTYISTLGYVMEEAAKQKIKVMVLDRPNPLGGVYAEGPVLEPRLEGFTGYHNMPIRHGMTLGELANLFNAERNIGADLEVVKMPNWDRRILFDDTGLPWVNPSPNIRSVREAALYPGIGILEVLPISVGRGTDAPFEVIGAPWIDGLKLSEDLNARKLPGVTFEPTRFTPTSSVHHGESCGGVQIFLWDRKAYRPCALGIQILDALHRLYPDHINAETMKALTHMVGNDTTASAILQDTAPEAIIASWSTGLEDWLRRRQPFLLY